MMKRLENRNNSQRMRRVNYTDEDTEEDTTDGNEEQFVLQIDGNGTKPFLWKAPFVEITLKPSSTLDHLYIFLRKRIYKSSSAKERWLFET